MSKTMKELRGLSEAQRKERVEEFKKELLKLNAQVASGANAANPGLLRQYKKNIARLKTLQNETHMKSGGTKV
ncbi:TPA: 50S ribosomal protein L29 [Candidatus Woesearchaeota archaeon]|nr:50S ribosomal protein L29 [Candidatus Woesearchaeota archaeon]